MKDQIMRVYVEKREGFDVDARAIYADIKSQLNIEGLLGLRVFYRYDCSGLTRDEFESAIKYVFCEPNMDAVYNELPAGLDNAFCRELLPGQYDQRADSAQQCICMIAEGTNPTIRCATIFAPLGSISSQELESIKTYLINPVEARIGSMGSCVAFDENVEVQGDVPVFLGFRKLSQDAMRVFIRENGLAMSLDDAMFVAEHFKEIGRDPTETEIKVIDTYWSDHCRHTTFSTRIDGVAFASDPISRRIGSVFEEYLNDRHDYYGDKANTRPVTLMDIATINAKLMKKRGELSNLDVSEEINACSIEVDAKVDGKSEPYLLMFKNETHNHPTEIEPFGGAATCLGGAIRDPLSGRAFVHQAMRVTGSGDPRTPFNETIAGKLPQRSITTTAAKGYSSYGNQIGLATGMVHEFYHPGYVAKRMEIGVVVAAAKKENVVRLSPQAGDVVLLVGGRTGRDGCGGATGSSKAHDSQSLSNCSAEVQKGNPITERKIQRLFRNADAAKLIKRCNDFGAGGVSVAVGELADGLHITLDNVLKKYDGLTGTELAISESQERMAVVVAQDDAPIFTSLAEAENLECVRVATVTDDATVTIMFRGKKIVELSRAFLNTNGVLGKQNISVNLPKRAAEQEACSKQPVGERFVDAISDLNCASLRALSERFDSTVGAYTVLMPFSGRTQRTKIQSMAARLPLRYGVTDSASITAFGFDPYISSNNPFLGSVFAVTESLLRTACAGGDTQKTYLTLQEYFCRLNNDPARWSQPFAALLGAYLAQKKLNVAAIGGKDSMSGSFMDLDVPPTLVSFAVTPADAKDVISCEFKKPGNKLFLVRAKYDEDGVVDFDALSSLMNALTREITKAKPSILSAYSLGSEPPIVAAAKCCFGNNLGARLNADTEELFDSHSQGVLFELDASCSLNDTLKMLGAVEIGELTEHPSIYLNGDMLSSLDDAYAANCAPLENVFPARPYSAEETSAVAPYKKRSAFKPRISCAKPRVLIPVFPGTNCEIESENAFLRAGASVETLVIKNTRPGDIAQSIDALRHKLNACEILFLPGGFSAGDEPEGSGKFIAATLRSTPVKDAINELLNARDGLILGICNGFQTLIKLGLLPYGEIRETSPSAPTLTFNRIGRHQSRIVATKVTSTLSPWFSALNVGDVLNVPISHGEGRFVCASGFNELVKRGQIAAQYVDLDANPSMDIDFNPSGSFAAVEAITSEDGRILGKMGHTERYCNGLYKNVPGNYDASIFASGVKYFS